MPIAWGTNKIKRIVDNTLAAESISLVNGLKEGIHLRELLEEIWNMPDRSIDVEALIDNKGAHEAIHSTTAVADKRLRRDISIVKQLLNEKEIRRVLWC